ncbi:MAG: LuxR C-terminal-related transcriptional regulator, partial [Nakamurella sp.]
RGSWDYVRRLLTVSAGHGEKPTSTTPSETAGRNGSELVDPLSERELDVLRLLTTDLDGPGIARRLFVSVNTVRTHTKSIYAKLGVNSRRAAVRRAAELNILPDNR